MTQGPKDGQHNHFWQMVWHETADPAVVVMLTQTTEAGRDKCSQYFPDQKQEEAMKIRETSYDQEEGAVEEDFAAELRLLELNVEHDSQCVVRKLQLTVGAESKIVWHLLFAGWPDWGVPDHSQQDALFALIELVREKSKISNGPAVVHCSAGVGRSGTFIALDHLLEELDQGVFDDASLLQKAAGYDPNPLEPDLIFHTVNCLRQQRMMMVQSDAQLIFVYQVLREKWLQRHGQADESVSASTGLSQQMAGDLLDSSPLRHLDLDWLQPSPTRLTPATSTSTLARTKSPAPSSRR